MKERYYAIIALLLLISLSFFIFILLGWNDRSILIISGIHLLFYFYFPLYIKNRRSIIHLFKSLLLPLAGIILISSSLWRSGDFLLSRLYGLIWLYSSIGTSFWKLKTDRRFSYYNTVFFVYQAGMLIYSTAITFYGFDIEGENMMLPSASRVGAILYMLKLLNAPSYLKSNRDKPLICLSFFTPIIAIGLFFLL